MDLYEIFITHNRSWSIHEIICFSILFLIAALIIGFLLCKKKIIILQGVSSLTIFLFLGIVFASTVFTRTPNPKMQFELQLFWSWREVVVNRDWKMLEEILLNCMLLLPFGVLLPIALNRTIGAGTAFLIGLMVSAAIETCQLIFQRGLFEWDDMIHNAMGCMAGCLMMGAIRRKCAGYRR